jgi:4-hydroxyphenylpyruvate dioxygenase-like putative hemolysin
MNGKIKRMIIGYARRLSSAHEPWKNVKDACKVAPALHKCAKCGSLNYDGDSEKSFQKYVEQFPQHKVNFRRIEIDHISPVVKITGWTTWDNFFESLFCDEDGYRPLCRECHNHKTKNENSHRQSHKAKGKK